MSQGGWRSRHSAARVSAPTAASPNASSATGQLPTALVTAKRLRVGFGLVAFCVYLWTIHSYRLPLGDAAIITALLAVLLARKPVVMPVPLALFGAFVAWSAIGLAFTIDRTTTYTWVTDLAKVWLIVFCLVNLVRTPAQLRFIAIVWLGLFAFYPVRGAYYNQYICQCNEAGRVAWNFVFSNPNDLAAISFLPLGLCAVVAYLERVKLWKYAAAAGVVLVSLLIFLTQSRGALLALMASVLFLVLLSKRRGQHLTIIGALAVVAALAAPRGVWDRLAGLSNVSVATGMQGVDEEGSAEARWRIWQIAARMVREYPITGVGIGMYPIHHARLSNDLDERRSVRGRRDTHSAYFRIAAEMGIPGLALFLGIWFALFRDLAKKRRLLKKTRPREHQAVLFLQLSMAALLFASIFGTYGYFVYTYLHMAIVWLGASILAKEPWYVPARAQVASHAAMVPQYARRGAAR